MIGSTEQVVKNNLTRLYRRLGVANRVGLVNALRDQRGQGVEG
jgi:DNA-binding CsgD family transcriptional regulator